MFGGPPFLRYPLWRFTAVLVVASTALSGLVFMKLRHQENVRRKKWEDFFKFLYGNHVGLFDRGPRTYDAYEHVKEICSHAPGIMHSCPKDLALAYEKAGLKN